MKNTEVNPKVVIGIVAAILILIGLGYWKMGNSTGVVDISKVPKAEIMDPDPPKPGQPGYKERTTDPDPVPPTK